MDTLISKHSGHDFRGIEKNPYELWEDQKGKYVKIGVTEMVAPHDPSAPIDQVAGCNCDIKYFVSLKKKKAEKNVKKP